MNIRPWGALDWCLGLADVAEWFFVGVMGTEERSLCAWRAFQQMNPAQRYQLLQIKDVYSDKYSQRTRVAVQQRLDEFASAGGTSRMVTDFELMTELFKINDLVRGIADREGSVVLDISSFPKRFFFPILRELLVNPNVRNLLLTYSSPDRYAEDAPLYEDTEPWASLPGFAGNGVTPELWIVSVGFLVETLREHITGSPEESMKLLIPFPAPLGALRRTWESVASLEEGHSDNRFEIYRVETLSLSSAFDRICSLAGSPRKPVALAPFGPKPTSAAMCIYAAQTGAPVFYPQPTIYHPEYSIGIRGNDVRKAVTAYWVKFAGQQLYTC